MTKSLQSTTALNGFDQHWGATRLYEPDTVSMLSLAIPQSADAPFGKFLKNQWDISLPEVGRVNSKGTVHLLRLAQDQCFLQIPHVDIPLSSDLKGASEGAAYLTDQSDSWASLTLDGPDALPALERLCMLDLHPDAFGIGQMARTLMEHLNVLIWRQDEHRYTLMSARSSAASFLHALTTSLDNIQ